MSKVTLQQAADMAGISKQAIRKAVKAGKLTSDKDEQGRILVQAGDVERVWSRKPVTSEKLVVVGDGTTNHSALVDSGLQGKIDIRDKEISLLKAQIDDLKSERDDWKQAFEREQEQTRATTRLLEDQREKAEKGFWARLLGR
ncbi:MAG: hypothetical protein KDI90_06850 [Alphaproteobacteria bacterium]|nr:hypothetical protein [Alphaproteobacteria bacterium]MCB2013243.1 hypothetical protein [Geminicoccaceae bacterium]